MRKNVMGVGFDDLSLEEAAERAAALAAEKRAAFVVTPNPEIVSASWKNEALAAALREADLVVPDGIGVVYAAKILGTPLKERVPGIDLAAKLFERFAGEGKRVFLLGAKPGVAEAAAETIKTRYPGLVICGTHDGYFQEDGPVLEAVNAAEPDLMLVCLGFPKQELWMHRNRAALRVGLMMGLGGVLDVFAGNVRRAPESWQKLGLEWLYRLLHQPSRIGRMARLPLFLVKAVFRRLSGKKD